jgi:transposase
MDERMRFVIRLKDGETMASLCREFGISRKTGYKIFERYEQCGLEGLSDRARRPFRYANQLPESVEAAIVGAKREKPHWGARKIRERLLRRLPHAIKTPAASTFTPCWIAMGWSSPWAGAAVGQKARPCPMACFPTISGAPITRESFSLTIDVIVIR